MLNAIPAGAMQSDGNTVRLDHQDEVESVGYRVGHLPAWTAAMDPPHQLPSMLHLSLLMRTHGYVDPEDDRCGPVRPRLKSLMSTLLFERVARNQSSGSFVLKLLHLIEISSSEPPAPFLLSLFHQALHHIVSAETDSNSELSRDADLKYRLLNAILARTLERSPASSSHGPEAFDLLIFLTQSLAPAIPLGDERIRRINEYFWSHFSSRTDDYLVIMSQWLSHHAILSMYVDEYEWTDIHTMIHSRLPKCMPILHGLLAHVKQSESNRLRFLRHDGLNIATIIHRRVHRGPAWASAIAVELLHICKLPLRMRISSRSGGRAEVAIVDRVRVSSPTVHRPAQPPKRQDTYPPRGQRKLKSKPSESKVTADAKKGKDDSNSSGAKDEKERVSKSKEEEEAEAAEMTRRRSIRDAKDVIQRLRRASVDVPTAADGTGPLRVERNTQQQTLPLTPSSQGRRKSSTKDLKGSVVISGNRLLEPPVEEGSLDNVAEDSNELEEEMDPLERSVSLAIRPILAAMRQGAPWFASLRRAFSFTSESPLSVIEALILVERIHALLVAALDTPKDITMAMLDPNEDPDSDEAARASGDGQAVLVDWDEEVVDRYISGCLAQLRVLIVHMGLVATVADSSFSPSLAGGTSKAVSPSIGAAVASQKAGRAGSATSHRPTSAAALQASHSSATPTALARRGTLVSSATPLGTSARRPSTITATPIGKRALAANSVAPPLTAAATPTSSAKERGNPILLSVNTGATIPPLYRLPNAATSTDPQVSIDSLIHHAQVKKRLLELGVSRTLLRILNRSYAVRVLYYAVTLVQIYSVEPEAASELLRAQLDDSHTSHESKSSSNGGLGFRPLGSTNDVFAAFDIGEAISTDSLYGDAISGGGTKNRSTPAKRKLSVSSAPWSADPASRGRRPSVVESSSMDISSHRTSISITTTPASRRNSVMSRRSSVANPSLLLPQRASGRRGSVSPSPLLKQQQSGPRSSHNLSPAGSPNGAGRRVSISPMSSPEVSLASTPHQAAERLRRGSVSPTLAASPRGRASSHSPSNGRLKSSGALTSSSVWSIGGGTSHLSLTGPDAGGGVRDPPPETAAILEPLHILRHSGHMGIQRNARAAFWSLCRHGSMTTARTAAQLVRESVWEKVGLD